MTTSVKPHEASVTNRLAAARAEAELIGADIDAAAAELGASLANDSSSAAIGKLQAHHETLRLKLSRNTLLCDELQRRLPAEEKATLIASWREATAESDQSEALLRTAKADFEQAQAQFVERKVEYQKALHRRDLSTMRAHSRYQRILDHKHQNPHLYEDTL